MALDIWDGEVTNIGGSLPQQPTRNCGASALVASIADANIFDNGRQLSAWLGLVPRQHSSGGKPTLLGISKRGDVYLRTLLIHGARSAIVAAQNKAVSTLLEAPPAKRPFWRFW